MAINYYYCKAIMHNEEFPNCIETLALCCSLNFIEAPCALFCCCFCGGCCGKYQSVTFKLYNKYTDKPIHENNYFGTNCFLQSYALCAPIFCCGCCFCCFGTGAFCMNSIFPAKKIIPLENPGLQQMKR